jgi:hypothetical protein
MIGAIYRTNLVTSLSESADGSLGQVIFSQIAPNILIMVNFYIVPIAIDTASYKLVNMRKTDRHRSNLLKHFLFNLFATCLIPMYSQSSFVTLF